MSEKGRFRPIAHSCANASWLRPRGVCSRSQLYNFVCIHQTVRVTPAIAAGLSDRLGEMGDVVKQLDDFEAKRIETQKLAALAPVGAW